MDLAPLITNLGDNSPSDNRYFLYKKIICFFNLTKKNIL